MTDQAPKRIWVWIDYDGEWDGMWHRESRSGEPVPFPSASYVRADSIPRELLAQVLAEAEEDCGEARHPRRDRIIAARKWLKGLADIPDAT